MAKLKIYNRDEIQKVYSRHHYHCGSVVYSKDGGFTWQSVPMDSGKWNQELAEDEGKDWIKPWVYAFIEIENNSNKKCYCGKPVDLTNPDCYEYNLCKDHATDV